jgi:hypothetical protein
MLQDVAADASLNPLRASLVREDKSLANFSYPNARGLPRTTICSDLSLYTANYPRIKAPTPRFFHSLLSWNYITKKTKPKRLCLDGISGRFNAKFCMTVMDIRRRRYIIDA